MRILTFDEQRQYLAAASQPLRDVAELMLETGMRPEEVFRIRTENVHLDESYLFNPYGKTKAARRRVPLNSMAQSIIKRRLDAARGPFLFPSRKNMNEHLRSVQTGHVAAVKKSKLNRFRLYDGRHTFATRAAQSGECDLATLAALLGHSKLNMVMRYCHPQEKHQAETVKRLEQVNAAKEIAEFEKKNTSPEKVPTISPTATESQDAATREDMCVN